MGADGLGEEDHFLHLWKRRRRTRRRHLTNPNFRSENKMPNPKEICFKPWARPAANLLKSPLRSQLLTKHFLNTNLFYICYLNILFFFTRIILIQNILFYILIKTFLLYILFF